MTSSGLIPHPTVTRAAPPGDTRESVSADIPREPLRFPGEDGGQSLAEAAQRDLNAALQLLAERAQYITSAAGAAIALEDGTEMVCRASAGHSAPEVGATLDVNTGLSGESVRTGLLLHCNDTEGDTRVNHETCRMLGIGSLLVMPLIVRQKVIGLFELLSEKAHAFQEHDIAALERLGEMVLTAIEHARMSKHTSVTDLRASAMVAATQAPAGNGQADSAVSAMAPVEQASAIQVEQPAASPFGERGQIRNCEACGFPVSGQRKYCVDCESRQKRPSSSGEASLEMPGFLTQFGAEETSQPGWLRKNGYVIGTLLIVLLTVGLLLWSR